MKQSLKSSGDITGPDADEMRIVTWALVREGRLDVILEFAAPLVISERRIDHMERVMEFIQEDAHPANQLLDLGPDSPSERYPSGYQQAKVSPLPYGSPQQMPGQATVPLAMRAKALEKKVDPGDASTAAIMPMRHEKDAASVEYIADVRTRREAYEVSIAATMRRGVKGEAPAPFDTKTIKAAFLGRTDIGAARLGETTDQQAKFQQLTEYWVINSLIWVCTAEQGRLGGVFYSSVCRIGSFHHSSFTSGGSLVGAGEWIVENGKLMRVSANSGHYMPTLTEFHRGV
ncbi:MAG TPA: hypothetical protein VHV78_10310, partial [Gemmatimonadaceae bacterium]|nr:hypothetical protein [Gemmatimonadaceae bacterium]